MHPILFVQNAIFYHKLLIYVNYDLLQVNILVIFSTVYEEEGYIIKMFFWQGCTGSLQGKADGGEEKEVFLL